MMNYRRLTIFLMLVALLGSSNFIPNPTYGASSTRLVGWGGNAYGQSSVTPPTGISTLYGRASAYHFYTRAPNGSFSMWGEYGNMPYGGTLDHLILCLSLLVDTAL